MVDWITLRPTLFLYLHVVIFAIAKSLRLDFETRKTTGPKVVDNDASDRSLHLSSASCDIELWPPDPQSWLFYAHVPLTVYADLNFIQIGSFFLCSYYKFGNGETNGRTGREHDAPPACLV